MKMSEKNEDEEPERILPMGSVVRLVPDGALVMVTGRAALSVQNGVKGWFDYVGVPYPFGVADKDAFLFFNREDVYEIEYLGFVNSDEQVFAANYDDQVAASPYPKLAVPKQDKE